MWAARRKASGAVRSRARASSRWRPNSAGAASGLRRVKDVSAESLLAFLQDAVEPGATIHTDGWRGYAGLPAAGYRHQVTVISGGSEPAHEVMPRVHKVAALLKRWLLGTLQGGIQHQHLDYYLDEFTFRFNRRRSQARGLLFHRLVQQAMAIGPAPYHSIIKPGISANLRRIGGMKGIPPIEECPKLRIAAFARKIEGARVRIESGPPGFAGRVLLVGCGSVGQTVLPLLLRHFALDPANLTVLTADGRGHEVATAHGIRFEVAPLTRDRFAPCSRRVCGPATSSSTSPWTCPAWSCCGSPPPAARSIWTRASSPGPAATPTPTSSPAERSNQAFRARALALRAELGHGQPDGGDLPGSQPGPGLAAGQGRRRSSSPECRRAPRQAPTSADGWARLFRDLGIRTIQISEHDSQVSRHAQGGGRVRQHLVGRRFPRRGRAAGRAGLGHRRGPASARRAPAAGRRPGHLSPAAGHGRAGSQLVAGRRPVRRLPDHAHGIALDRRSPDAAVEGTDHLSADRSLRLSALPGRAALGPRAGRPRLRAAAATADPGGDIVSGQDELGVLLAGHRAGRLLVRLAAVDRRGAPHRAARQRHRAPGRGRDPGRHGGRHRTAGRWACASPRSSTSRRCWRQPGPISAAWSARGRTGRR